MGEVWSLYSSAFVLWRFPAVVSEAPLGLDVRGAELRRKALAPTVETVHGIFLLWLVAKEGAGHNSTRPSRYI